MKRKIKTLPREKKYLVEITIYGKTLKLREIWKRFNADSTIEETDALDLITVQNDTKSILYFLGTIKNENPALWKMDQKKYFFIDESSVKINFHNYEFDYNEAFSVNMKSNGFGVWEPVHNELSPKYKKELKQIKYNLEEIYEKITHISEEMYASISPKITTSLNKLANSDDVTLDLLTCVTTVASSLQKGIKSEERRSRKRTPKATRKVRSKKKKTRRRSLRSRK